MTLKEIEIFFVLSENENVSLSAKKMKLTQSAVSLSIKSLEKDLGVKLFDRIGKKLKLNENGKFFKSKIYNSFYILNETKNIFKKDNFEGEIKFCVSKTINSFVLPKIIYEFRTKYPKVILNKESINSKSIIEKVKNGDIDFGLIEVEFDEKDIIKEKIGSDELIVVCNDNQYKNKTIYIDELFDKKWILREVGSGTRDMFLASIEDIKIPVFFETNDVCEIKSLLHLPNTITCISEYVVKDELDKTLFKINVKNLKFKRNFYLIYHKNKTKTFLFNKFIKFVKENIK